jgi:hypothetical protein
MAVRPAGNHNARASYTPPLTFLNATLSTQGVTPRGNPRRRKPSEWSPLKNITPSVNTGPVAPSSTSDVFTFSQPALMAQRPPRNITNITEDDEDEEVELGDMYPEDEDLLEDDTVVFTHRWRAWLGNTPINSASRTSPSSTTRLSYEDFEAWIGKTRTALANKGVFQSATYTAWYDRQPKGERGASSMNVDDEHLPHIINLIKHLHATYPCKALMLDYDAYFDPPQATQVAPTPVTTRSRPGIATRVQEEGIGAVIATEINAGNGPRLGIIDRWICQLATCPNTPNICWVDRREGQVDRVQDHYPVTGELLAMWNRDVMTGNGSAQQPSDRVIMKLKQHKEARKKPKKRKSEDSDDDLPSLKHLCKVLLVERLSSFQKTSPPPKAATPPPAPTTVQSSSPIELPAREEFRVFKNFFKYWAQRDMENAAWVMDVYEELRSDQWDFDTLADTVNGMTMQLWTEQYEWPLGSYRKMRRILSIFKRAYKRINGPEREKAPVPDATCALGAAPNTRTSDL